MELFNDTDKSLDRIELLLKSIDFQLTKIAALLMSVQEKESSGNKTGSTHNNEIPEMVTLQEASRRTGLSYDFLRKQCIQGNLTHIRVGNGKRLVNMDSLMEQLNSAHGYIRKKEQMKEDSK